MIDSHSYQYNIIHSQSSYYKILIDAMQTLHQVIYIKDTKKNTRFIDRLRSRSLIHCCKIMDIDLYVYGAPMIGSSIIMRGDDHTFIINYDVNV